MKEPVDHIIRPLLPWRSQQEPQMTECGYDASKVKSMTREAYFARLKEYGRQRTGLVTCMTCMSTAANWPTWQEDPRLAVSREVTWEAVHYSGGQVRQWSAERGHRLLDELLAIETLIAAHPDEFQQLLSDIDARREWLKKKAASTTTKAKPDRGGGPKWRPI